MVDDRSLAIFLQARKIAKLHCLGRPDDGHFAAQQASSATSLRKVKMAGRPPMKVDPRFGMPLSKPTSMPIRFFLRQSD
ncbi:MAG: hypothetical protein HY852_15680 [Bradyrhizobium sp.]|uniref:hypothetical protein n=1 Tax=Bradyrhizobium sp. TaxID=376 RepID=UPI0025BD6F72|nr:hypothetical protein [Bradyrhizobium sp.]MBI5263251.1 hypothetical protein [Bradyrhizobium sp.]